jgi:hypothetical protein
VSIAPQPVNTMPAAAPAAFFRKSLRLVGTLSSR